MQSRKLDDQTPVTELEVRGNALVFKGVQHQNAAPVSDKDPSHQTNMSDRVAICVGSTWVPF